MEKDEDAFQEQRHLVSIHDAGQRLDSFLSVRTGLSRCSAQRLIQEGLVWVDGKARSRSYRLKPGEAVRVLIPPPPRCVLRPEPIPLRIVYEDAWLVVIDKEPGMVVHPSPGHASGTVVHGLLHRFPGLEAVGAQLRPGIVHRLDKDTSGLLVVARTEEAYRFLVNQFKSHRVRKEYLALVVGRVEGEEGEIEAPIGRSPKDRQKMGVRTARGRAAITRFLVEERFAHHTLLRVRPETGRTHQIRVHLAHLGHPVWGDRVYGGKRLRAGRKEGEGWSGPRRQMLHAWRLCFPHPAGEGFLALEAPIPADMEEVLRLLRSELGGPGEKMPLRGGQGGAECRS